MSNTSIFASPGQNVSLVVQTTDFNGSRVDGYMPNVESVIFPDLSSASGYPQNMQRIDTGLYMHVLTIPTGVVSLGTFIVSMRWVHPNTGLIVYSLAQIQVAMPFGNSNVAPA
jgi:hypothetical protein